MGHVKVNTQHTHTTINFHCKSSNHNSPSSPLPPSRLLPFPLPPLSAAQFQPISPYIHTPTPHILISSPLSSLSVTPPPSSHTSSSSFFFFFTLSLSFF